MPQQLQNPGAQSQKVQDAAAQGTENHKKMKPTVTDIQGKQTAGQQTGQAKPQIQRNGQGVFPAAQQPQKIVVQPQRRAESDGARQLDHLLRYRVLHQPKSRENNPPVGRSAS